MKHLSIVAASFLFLAACSKEPAAPPADAGQAPVAANPTEPPAVPAARPVGRKETPANPKPGDLVAVQEFHEDGKLYTERSERVGPDGRTRVRQGPMKAWFKNGKPMIEGGYDEQGKKSGHWKYWDDMGQLVREGDYVDDMREGDWTETWPNGKPRSQGFIHVDLPEGPWKYWHENGRPMAEGEYINNKRDGVWLFYFEDGTPDAARSGTYKDGLKLQ